MRTEMIKVRLSIPFPFNRPDKNNVMYSKDAVNESIRNLKSGIPIVYRDNQNCRDGVVIGHITSESPAISLDDKRQTIVADIDGVIYFGGTECVVDEIQNDIVEKFTITGVGVSTI